VLNRYSSKDEAQRPGSIDTVCSRQNEEKKLENRKRDAQDCNKTDVVKKTISIRWKPTVWINVFTRMTDAHKWYN
jgi:hypothetical protein